MKRLFFIVAISLVVFTNWICKSDTEILFHNMSNKKIDSVIIYLNSYKCKFESIAPYEIRSKKIDNDSIDVKHDIAIVPYVFINDTSINGQYFYNDLGGIFKKGKLILNDSLATKWEILKW